MKLFVIRLSSFNLKVSLIPSLETIKDTFKASWDFLVKIEMEVINTYIIKTVDRKQLLRGSCWQMKGLE